MISIGCAIYRIKKEVENTNSGFAVEVAYLILQEPRVLIPSRIAMITFCVELQRV
jgi:hypothetical protein